MKNTPTIILVRPQMGENIGATARAMANCGMKDLSLVAPRDGWPDERATTMAAGAFEHMNEVRIFETVTEAVSDCQKVYATTARRRDLVKPVFIPDQVMEDIVNRPEESTAILFGAERTGLTNEELSMSDALMTIPLNSDFSSLNLAQAVLVVAYEWSKQSINAPQINLDYGDSIPVSKDKLHEFLERLDEELENGHFFRNPDMKPAMVNNIHAMFTRAQLSDQEVRTLHGMVSALIRKKAKKEAK